MNINELHRAFYSRDVEAIERWMETEGVNVNVTNWNRETPLHWAAERGHVDIVQRLMKKGANVNARDRLGETPLHLATRSGNYEVVEILLNNGAYINDMDDGGIAALHVAIIVGHMNILQTLLMRGANVHVRTFERWTPLLLATEYGNVDIVDLLLSYGANVNDIGFRKRTSLHLAAIEGHVEIVDRLLAVPGVDIEARDEIEKTPSLWAAGRGHAEIVRMLWSKGADLNVRNDIGETVYEVATDRVKTMLRGLVTTRREVLLHLYIRYGFPIEMVRTINGYLPWLPIMIRVQRQPTNRSKKN